MTISSIGPLSNQPQVQSQVSQKTKTEDSNPKEVSKELKAEGTKEIGEKVFQEAMEEISKKLSEKNILVSSVYDPNTGMQLMRISHIETGNKIADLPPEAAVEIAEKAKEQTIGWLLDRLI